LLDTLLQATAFALSATPAVAAFPLIEMPQVPEAPVPVLVTV